MKRTRKKHNSVIKAKGWWWRRSNPERMSAKVFQQGDVPLPFVRRGQVG